MTNDELKKKIAQITAKHLCPNKKSHFYLYGNSVDCYNRDNFAECMPICDTVDALIAAGIGDVKAAEHRAEVAERALKECSKRLSVFTKTFGDGATEDQIYEILINKAEKELSEVEE